jgi:thiol-disulfide isomerase/thioredoxin
MKNISAFLILFLVYLSGCKTSRPVAEITPPVAQQADPDTAVQEVDFSDQSTWILGYFNLNNLLKLPYSMWYVSGYEDYKYNPDAVDKLKEIGKSDLAIKIVMGTWCPDSRREVPRFMRILNASNFATDKIQLIGVDNEKNSPIENFDSLNIQRVPTFIIYKNNIEIGRIIENPTTSLEQDMVNILTRNE